MFSAFVVFFWFFKILSHLIQRGLKPIEPLQGGGFYHWIDFFYEQPVYKQLTLGWQIAKQLSGFKPISLSDNATTKL